MLKNLHIENIAVIENADIDFSKGFNVLTGETGAGKSIIIDSLNAVLGERTSKELIRYGCDKAQVSALFSDISETVIKLLEENGYETENGELLILRTLSLTGSGTVKINGKAATVGILKTICKNLVNIHGQHDNQGLLNPDNHYLYIDRLAENKHLLNDYYNEFKHLNSVRKELAAIETDEDEKRRRIDLLNYEIKELTDADIHIGEAEELKKKLEVARNLNKMKEALVTSYASISGDDYSDGAISLLQNAAKVLRPFDNEDFEAIEQKLLEACTLVDEIGVAIRNSLANLNGSDFDFEQISERLDTIYRLMLKYGDSEEKLLNRLQKSQKELETIEFSEQKANELAVELDKSTERLIALGEKLTDSRNKTAVDFANKVTERLKYLDMPNICFKVNIEKGRYTKLGCDIVEFLISTNIGEDLKSLSKIASGGELSRIMLAIKAVLADKDDVDTLVFDEVDTGISGSAAGKVGRMLKEVSNTRQVVCVTHLAQICAFGGNHLKISKAVRNERTYTEVTPLSYEERINEIARIMSGTDITTNLYKSAKELLDGGLKI